MDSIGLFKSHAALDFIFYLIPFLSVLVKFRVEVVSGLKQVFYFDHLGPDVAGLDLQSLDFLVEFLLLALAVGPLSAAVAGAGEGGNESLNHGLGSDEGVYCCTGCLCVRLHL